MDQWYSALHVDEYILHDPNGFILPSDLVNKNEIRYFDPTAPIYYGYLPVFASVVAPRTYREQDESPCLRDQGWPAMFQTSLIEIASNAVYRQRTRLGREMLQTFRKPYLQQFRPPTPGNISDSRMMTMMTMTKNRAITSETVPKKRLCFGVQTAVVPPTPATPSSHIVGTRPTAIVAPLLSAVQEEEQENEEDLEEEEEEDLEEDDDDDESEEEQQENGEVDQNDPDAIAAAAILAARIAPFVVLEYNEPAPYEQAPPLRHRRHTI